MSVCTIKGSYITKLDLSDKNLFLLPQRIDICMGAAEAALMVSWLLVSDINCGNYASSKCSFVELTGVLSVWTYTVKKIKVEQTQNFKATYCTRFLRSTQILMFWRKLNVVLPTTYILFSYVSFMYQNFVFEVVHTINSKHQILCKLIIRC